MMNDQPKTEAGVYGGIALVGLGSGNLTDLAAEARQLLAEADEVWVRQGRHPALRVLSKDCAVRSLLSDPQIGGGIPGAAARLVELGRRPEGVTYAVPGSPLLGDAVCRVVATLADEKEIPLKILSCVSGVEQALEAVGAGPAASLALVDALEIAGLHVPSFVPGVPALISGVTSASIASRVSEVMMTLYPAQHEVVLITPMDESGWLPQSACLKDVSAAETSHAFNLGTMLFIPPLAQDAGFESFQEIVAHLRAPDGCPWDREQTHQTLRQHLLEETYEALEALDANDMTDLCEELGDLLLQVVLHAQIAGESGNFTMVDILQGINRKLVYRHPHVFGSLDVEDVDGVLRNWEALKSAERQKDERKKKKGLLDGVPTTFPALAQAEEIQGRVARVGFDWPDISGVWEKLYEEIAEVRSAPDEQARAAELGDLLFSVVNLARWYNVEPESVLRATNLRFRTRFAHIEKRVRRQGLDMSSMTLEQLDEYWEEAKREG
jgi:tetrapyrrole methylase family protein / MazG family protein